MKPRVVITSVAPLFPNVVYGGSQAILIAVANALGNAGSAVDVLSSKHPDNRGSFNLQERVTVHPILELKAAFPEPYAVHPARLARTVRVIRPWLEQADRVYLHADIFHFRDLVPADTPVIRSFHDYHYETALLSAFARGADLTIVPSEYLARCIDATLIASSIRSERLAVIPNGIDLSKFKPDRPDKLNPAKRLPPKREMNLLFPHRPDIRKGVMESLQLVKRLIQRFPKGPINLVIPRHIDADRMPEMATEYQEIELQANALGIRDSIRFTDWKSQDEMPDLFRSCDLTLCLGNIIESFGLTAYESITCGTPVIAANVGAYRLLPDVPGIHRVDFGDVDAAEHASVSALSHSSEISGGIQKIITNTRTMTSAYVDAILRPENYGPLHLTHGMDRDDGSLRLAPWCGIAGDRVYDDYAYGYRDMPGLARFLGEKTRSGGQPFDDSLMKENAVPADEIELALEASVLI